MNKSILVLTNGNDEQYMLMRRMFESFLFHNNTGLLLKFTVITDELSDVNISSLSKIGVQVIVLRSEIIADIKNNIGSNEHPLGKIAKPFFLKHYLLDLKLYDFVIYSDPDSILLCDLSELIECHKPNLITVSQSLLPTASYLNDRLYKPIKAGILKTIVLSDTQPEVCTGFFMGQRNDLIDLLDRWTTFMLSPEFNSLKDTNEDGFGWHDQDFFRCYHTLYNPLPLNILSPTGIIVTNPPAYLLYDFTAIKKSVTNIVVKLPEGIKSPIMVHFAGKTYENYPTIKELYL